MDTIRGNVLNLCVVRLTWYEYGKSIVKVVEMDYLKHAWGITEILHHLYDVENNLEESVLRWYGHVRTDQSMVVKRVWPSEMHGTLRCKLIH